MIPLNDVQKMIFIMARGNKWEPRLKVVNQIKSTKVLGSFMLLLKNYYYLETMEEQEIENSAEPRFIHTFVKQVITRC